MKRFFGGLFIEKEKLEEAGIDYPIKLEYYKRINEDIKEPHEYKFGISIVKTEYLEKDLNIESKDIKYITNDEIEADKILNIFKKYEVTPINSEEIITDLLNQNTIIDNI